MHIELILSQHRLFRLFRASLYENTHPIPVPHKMRFDCRRVEVGRVSSEIIRTVLLWVAYTVGQVRHLQQSNNKQKTLLDHSATNPFTDMVPIENDQ